MNYFHPLGPVPISRGDNIWCRKTYEFIKDVCERGCLGELHQHVNHFTQWKASLWGLKIVYHTQNPLKNYVLFFSVGLKSVKLLSGDINEREGFKSLPGNCQAQLNLSSVALFPLAEYFFSFLAQNFPSARRLFCNETCVISIPMIMRWIHKNDERREIKNSTPSSYLWDVGWFRNGSFLPKAELN